MRNFVHNKSNETSTSTYFLFDFVIQQVFHFCNADFRQNFDG